MQTEALTSRGSAARADRFIPPTLNDSSVVAAFSVTARGRLVAANQTMLRAMRNDSLDSLLGKSLPNELLVNSADWRHWEAARQNDGVRGVEVALRATDDKEVTLRGDIRRIPSRGGGESLLSGLFIDVTHVRGLENALQRSARMEALSALVTGAVHDFNNILTVLVGNLYLVGEGVRENQSLFEKVKAARDVARRGSELIRQLLSFAQPGPPQTGNVDVTELVTRLAPLLSRVVSSSIQLTMQLGKDVTPVNTNAALLESAIVNLVVNARDALDGPGNIRITVENMFIDEADASRHGVSAGRYVRTAVTDDGPGIPTDLQPQIFEPFFTTKTDSGGTGLGLSMVRRLAEQSQGTVQLESRPGAGTTLSILLPISEIDAATSTINTMPLSTLPTGNEHIVLIAQDGEILAMVQQSLKVLGYTVKSANEPRALPVLLTTNENVLIIIDNTVTKTVSIAKLKERISQLKPRARVLYIDDASSAPREATQKRNQLIKPFSLMELATTVRETLDGETRE